MRKEKKLNYLAAALMLIAFVAGITGCKKDPLNNLSAEESRIYISNVDSTVNFTTYKTFSVDDSMDIIQDGQFVQRISAPFSDSVINTIVQQMQQRGYTLVAKAATPDLAINLSEVINTQTALFSYGDYWDGYDSYYDPTYWGYGGYGYYYPPGFIGSYTIQSGGLEIDLLDLKNAASAGNKIKILWTGLARGENVFSSNNAATEVNALFNQSPYLKAN